MFEEMSKWYQFPPFYIPILEGKTLVRMGGSESYVNDYLQYTFKDVRTSYVMAPENNFGHERSPGNWTGIIGLLIRQEADLFAGSIPALPELAYLLGMSSSYESATFTILSGIPKRTFMKTPSLFSSISFNLWILFGFSLLFVSTLYFYISKPIFLSLGGQEIHKGLGINEVGINAYIEYVLTFYGLLFQRGFENLPENMSRRIFVSGWLIFVIVITTYLAGTLSSQLAVTDIPERIETLEDIIKYPDLKIYISKGITIETNLQLSEMETKKEIWKRAIEINGVKDFYEFTNDIMDEISRGDAVVVSNLEYVMMSMVNFACQIKQRPFYIAKEPFYYLPIVFPYSKSFDPQLVEKLNLMTATFTEGKFHHRYYRNSQQNARPCLEYTISQTSFTALSFEDMYEVFKLLCTGMATAGTALCVEIIFNKIQVLVKKIKYPQVESNPEESPAIEP